MKVRYHIYKDVKLKKSVSSDEEAYARGSREALERRYSFVAMCLVAETHTLYLGCTNAVGDLLVAFDLEKREFQSCGYNTSGLREKNELKIHKGLWYDRDNKALFFGTSTLSEHPELVESPGGGLIEYRIRDGSFREIARPTPGDFYQATNYNPELKQLYFYTMPGWCFGVYDLKKDGVVRLLPMSSIPHIGTIDRDGGVWGTYSRSRHAFFRYLAREDRFEFPKGCAFPNAVKASDVMYTGAGPIDSIITGRDGMIYTGSALGEFFRVDPESKRVEYLGKPFQGERLPAMCQAEDGWIYLAGGNDRDPVLARYDISTGHFDYPGAVSAEDGTTCYRCHEMVIKDNRVYIGETDNPERSGYLWECELES